MGLYRPIRTAIDPLISATYPIPKSAILPLVLLIFGLGEMSKIVMVALGVFYPVVINTITGVLQIDRIYLDVGKNFRASRWQTFRTIALPGALPSIMAGVKIGVGLGLILIAISEMVGAKTGIGFMIWDAWQVLSVETMYVGLLVIAIIGFVLTLILNEVESWLLPWRRERQIAGHFKNFLQGRQTSCIEPSKPNSSCAHRLPQSSQPSASPLPHRTPGPSRSPS